jgi:hypothetical protein
VRYGLSKLSVAICQKNEILRKMFNSFSCYFLDPTITSSVKTWLNGSKEQEFGWNEARYEHLFLEFLLQN